MVTCAPKLALGRSQRKGNIRVCQTADQMQEFIKCSPANGWRGFVRWCHRHVIIQDRATRQEVSFELFQGQRRVAPLLVLGYWIIALKGRQLGLTWLMAAYTLWRLTHERRFTAIVVSSQKLYAFEFMRRVKWIYNRLPPHMRTPITTDKIDELRFEAGSQETELFALVGTEKTARSLTGDLVVFDEASRIEGLDGALTGVEPALEVAGGQLVLLSTSAGPQGAFYDTWCSTYGEDGELLDQEGVGPTGFMPIFLHWSERPGRDRDWYQKQAERLRHLSPIAVKQEYPETPAEAFEYASGRIYPLFTRMRCVGTIGIPRHAVRFRAVDWGMSKSAHVVLWCAYIPGPPGLLVAPGCPNTIREMLGYRWDEKNPDKPCKENDHTCDALRYLVTTARGGLTGLVYVYREVWRVNAYSEGWTPMKFVAEVHELSGWKSAPPEYRDKWLPGRHAEMFETTIADRSNQWMIAHFNENDIPTQPQRRFKAPAKTDGQTDNLEGEVREGIAYLSMLIDGSHEIEKTIAVDRTGAAVAILREHQAARRRGLRFSESMDRVQQLHEARRALKVG